MRETYGAEDLLNTLISLEIKGNLNYERLAGKAPDEKSRKLFTILAAQELKHKKIYEGFKENLPGSEPVDEEYLTYISLLLKKKIPALKGEEIPTDFEEGFLLAMELEKDTIFFLHEAKMLLGAEQAREIDPLIAEERKHLQYLLEFK